MLMEEITIASYVTEAMETIKKLQKLEEEEEIEKLENIIVGLECDIEILSEQIEDDCIAHEEANKYYSEAHELAIENARLKKLIEKDEEDDEEDF